VEVPRHAVAVSYARASGPGGQNVNKVSTKASVRLDVSAEGSSLWLPPDVRSRLLQQRGATITKEGELLVSADETRSQSRNLALALERLQQAVDDACIVPKEFIQRRDLEEPETLKQMRVSQKRQQTQKKEQRRSARADFS
jgi:protein subunit release factor B